MKTKKISLKAEEICGYKVSEKMKKVWQVEMDILAELDRICKKYDIEYFAIDGTLLGAIRHNGFIPWDDDIDVGMTRENYDKFLKVASKELKKPYFLQNPYTDEIFRGHSQIRNSNTTAILYGSYEAKANQGIFLDVFILDKLPNGKIRTFLHKSHCRRMYKLLAGYYLTDKSSFKKSLHVAVSKCFFKFVNYRNYYAKYEKVCSKYNKSNSNYYNYVEHKYDGRKIRSEHIHNLTTHKFEYFDMPVPEKSEEFLTDYFGNWKEYVVGTSAHGKVFFDPEKSYKNYISKSIEELKELEDY